MSIQLAILSSIAVLADSAEASPFWWLDVNKRAVAAEEEKASPTTTTKKAVKAAVETDPNDKFSNKPVSKTTTSKKPTSSAKPTSKASSAQPSSSIAQPSASDSAISSSTPTSVVPPLMVTSTPSATNAIAPSATPSTAADTNGGGVSGGAIGGIVAAVIIIVLGAVAYFFVRRKKNLKEQRNRRMSAKPDPFTMGYGSDQAFHSQPPMQQTYQHQYGVQPNIAVTSPTSPTSPYYNNSGSSPYHDANNHIIAESMIPAAVPTHDSQYQQPYQSQLQPQPQQQQFQQTYQPQLQSQPQPPPPQINTAIDSNNTLVAAPIVAAAATGVTSATGGKLLPATQPNSVGVFYVAATYTPTLSDEIDIQTGDQVEVLVEYDDGWCQGINLTRGNIKGVFPKHCIDYTTGATAAAASVTTTGNSAAEVDRVKRVSSMYIA
ncbi:unnamed protein product [Mucor hiemalis]